MGGNSQDLALGSSSLHHPGWSRCEDLYFKLSPMSCFTATACFEAPPTLIFKPNVYAVIAILQFIKQLQNSKATHTLKKDLPGFLVIHQQMGQTTPHTLPGCVPTSAWN